ncbi:MAG: T9SS type A sorting domain-containing protein [Candidatus Kapaibacteriales bacterium]
MNFLVQLCRFCSIFAIIYFSSIGLVFSQNVNVVETWDQQGYGFYLKKVVSNTSICSGQTFSYTIYFSFPDGTQSATITDPLPSPLVFHSLSVTNACGTATASTPPPGSNGTVSVSFNSIPSGGCSGSMTIVVSFPNGITCNGVTASNRVCLGASYLSKDSGLVNIKICTRGVSTIAQATNTWQIEKKILGASWQGGSCPWKFYGDTATYVICVYKNNPAQCGINGQLNLVNGVVFDTLPAGAQFISSNPSVAVSGNVITWNVGNMSATTQYNKQCCTLKVYYPSAQFPMGTEITNSATLVGELGSANSPCGSFSQTASVCWKKDLQPPPSTTVSIVKWGSTNGQPGCNGKYWIRFCNTSMDTIPAGLVVIRDTLPASLNLVSVIPSPSSQWTVSSPSSGIIAATNSTAIPPGSCSSLEINFTISPTATSGSTITNCAWAFVQGIAPVKSCWNFVVMAPSPKVCIQKQVCNQQNSYAPGQTIRFRLRLQNIGGQDLSGATITDILNPNFQYVGNPSFYVSNAWNTSCNPAGGTSTWTPAPSFSVSNQTITISNVSIPASCQNVFWDGCGWYGTGTVPYYWIEFDVKILDTAGLGNIPNSFTISGGGLSAPVTSNTVYILTTGTVGFNLDKQVAPDTSNWVSSLTVPHGSSLNYRLQMNVSGNVPLRHVTFVDLLPRDAVTADNRILPNPCQPRGSQFDITYQGAMVLYPSATLYSNSNFQASAKGIAIFEPFITSCGTFTTWTSSPPPSTGDKNIGIYFTSPIGGGGTAMAILTAKASDSATAGQIACNSFAAGGAVRHYLNSSTSNDIAVTPLESNNICVAIDSMSKCYTAQVVQFPSVIGQTLDGCKYKLVISLNNPSATTLTGCVSSPDGAVSPNTFNVPPGTSNAVFQFIDTPPTNNVACIYLGVQDQTGACCLPCDTVCFDLPPCPTDTCCPTRVKIDVYCKGKDENNNLVYQISASGSFKCDSSLSPLTLTLSTPDGTLSPSVFTLNTPSSFSIVTNFTDTPPPESVMTIYYTIYGNGSVLCKDSARIKLPICPPQLQRCCSNFGLNLQSTEAKWYPSGLVVITGSASASLPLQRFSATIASAERKIWWGNWSGLWQRIFGDFVGGSATNPPLPLSVLTPYSRELVWGDSCTQQITPGAFKLYALFPPPPSGYKLKDSLQFTIRYSFTDCKCLTCDTLITYNVVRSPLGIIPPWENVHITQANNRIRVKIPTKFIVEGDTSASLRLTAIEFRSGAGNQITGRLVDTYSSKAIIASADEGRVVLLIPGPGSESETMEVDFGGVRKSLHIVYHYREFGSDFEGREEREIPIDETKRATGVVVQDEQRIDGVRTFSLAIVNKSDVPVSGLELALTPRPQPDGTVPNLIAVGMPETEELTIKCCSSPPGPTCKCVVHLYNETIEAGGTLRPLYVTLSGSNIWSEKKDKVELGYELTTKEGVVIGSGTVLLEGAISGIKDLDGSLESTLVPRISGIVPNPAVERATVSLWLPTELATVQLEVYNSFGNLVSHQILTNLYRGTTAVELDLNTLSNGAYQVVLRTPYGTSSDKLVIVR